MSNLEGLNFYGDYTLSQILTKNMAQYIQYGLLELGGYINISKGQTNYNGSNQSLLKPANVTGAPPNSIFYGAKNDWVYETGVSLKFPSGTAPYVASGIYVNNVYYPTGSSVSGNTYYIDFSRGRVVFASGLGTSSKVEIVHSLRAVQVYPAQDANIRSVVTDWRLFNSTGTQNNLAYKAYTPFITVDLVNYRTVRGVTLGSRGKNINATFEFCVYADNDFERSKIVDMLNFLETKLIKLYTLTNIPYPLNYRGELVNPQVNWKYLTDNFPAGEGRFNQDFSVTNLNSRYGNIFESRIRISLNLDVYPL